MSDKIETITSVFNLTDLEKIHINSSTNIEEIVRRTLINNISKIILDNIDSLPIIRKSRYIDYSNSTEHRLEMIVIDREELKRLKEIEKLFLEMGFTYD